MISRLFAVLIILGLPLQAATDIQQVKTGTGISAWLVEDRNIPFVALELRFKGGTSVEPLEKRGIVNLMMGLLEEGSGDMDARSFSTARDSLAASFGYDAYSDAVSVSARFLTENRDEAVALLRQSLVDPRFDQDAVDRVKSQVVSIIQSQEKDPNKMVGRAWNSEAFGDHPYGSEDIGTVDTVGSITKQDLADIHKKILVRDRVIVSAVGDISAQDLSELIDDVLGDLPETTPLALPSEADISLETGVRVVPFETPQSVILFGHTGIDRHDPDFFAAYVLNTIVGGGNFESRLMTELREKRGLTYGVGSYLSSRAYADLYLGQFATANDRVKEAVEVVQDLWRDIAENGVTEEELSRAKTYLTGAYPLRFDGKARIANILVGMQYDGLTPDYVKNRNSYIEAVTLEDTKRVAKRLIQPDALRFIIVGMPEGLE